MRSYLKKLKKSNLRSLDDYEKYLSQNSQPIHLYYRYLNALSSRATLIKMVAGRMDLVNVVKSASPIFEIGEEA